MKFTQKQMIWIFGSIIGAIIFPKWRALVGIVLFLYGTPALVKAIRHDGVDLEQVGLMLAGAILFIAASS